MNFLHYISSFDQMMKIRYTLNHKKRVYYYKQLNNSIFYCQAKIIEFYIFDYTLNVLNWSETCATVNLYGKRFL